MRYSSLTPLYDLLMQRTLRERTFKAQLIHQADIMAGHRVLDLGCGTATLTILLKRSHPDAHVSAVDGDPKVIQIVRRKVTESGLEIEVKVGMSFEMDFPDYSFDRVVSSLLFHHLTRLKNAKLWLRYIESSQPTVSYTLSIGDSFRTFSYGRLSFSYGCLTALKPQRTMLWGGCPL